MAQRRKQTTSNSPPPPKRAGSLTAGVIPRSLDYTPLSVAEVARLLRVSRNTVYYLIRCGDLPSFLVGRGQKVCGRFVRRYLERHSGVMRRGPF